MGIEEEDEALILSCCLSRLFLRMHRLGYKEANIEDSKAMLDDVAVAGLVGILRQLGDLAEMWAMPKSRSIARTTAIEAEKLKLVSEACDPKAALGFPMPNFTLLILGPDRSKLSKRHGATSVGQSYFGANVLHPRTIIPVMRYDIPIVIRNIFNLSAPGKMIYMPSVNENEDGKALVSSVKGFATIDNLALVNVEGTGMAGVPGTASAIFGAVKDVGANVIMISQML